MTLTGAGDGKKGFNRGAVDVPGGHLRLVTDRPLPAGSRLIQVNADNVVGFKFVRDRAVTQAGNHGCQAFALLHEIFGADGVIEALTEGNFFEEETAAGRMSGHAK